MIVGCAVCPHPPLLLRELTGGQDVAARLREDCGRALAQLFALDPEVIVVVGGADQTGYRSTGPVPVGAFGGAGNRAQPAGPLPLSLGVARRLLDGQAHGEDPAGALQLPVEMATVAWDATAEDAEYLARSITGRPERVGLLVMGDGSARRGVKAPGHLDDRAFGFDERVHRALADGDANALLGLEADLAAELMVAGRAAWQVMAAAVGEGPRRSEVLHADDPFGVSYFVAVWSCVSC